MQPLELDSNRFPRFYAGGERIDALRGLPPGSGAGPEDWVGATNTTFGSESEGLSRLPSGALVRDAIAADPEGFLGPDHVACHGPDPALLVKLLDAGERLPIHSHPSRAFAERHLGLRHGKTEAWVIVEADPGASVHVGPRESLDRATVRRWVDEQDAGAMLAALHETPVAAGDVVFVPAGTLHAIGAGILMVELQEPTDLSVLVEWRSTGIAGGPEHLELGWDVALESVDTEPLDLDHLVRRAGDGGAGPVRDVMPPDAAPYFGAEWLRPEDATVERPASFAILVVLDGSGTLRTDGGGATELRRGRTFLVPHAAGPTAFEGDVDVLRCLPPTAGSPRR